jgi:hypothetical protein
MKIMSTLTPAALLDQLIANANSAKAKAEADAIAAQAKIDAEQAEAKKLADALSLASNFEPVYKASTDRLTELEKAANEAKAKADAESFIIEQVKTNFASAQNLLNSFDAAKKVQEDNLIVKDQLDFLSNFLVQQMTERGL